MAIHFISLKMTTLIHFLINETVLASLYRLIHQLPQSFTVQLSHYWIGTSKDDYFQ